MVFFFRRNKNRRSPFDAHVINSHDRRFAVSHETCSLEQITTLHLPRELTKPTSHAIKPVCWVCNECYCFPYLVLHHYVWSALMSETSMMGNHSAGGPHLHHTQPPKQNREKPGILTYYQYIHSSPNKSPAIEDEHPWPRMKQSRVTAEACGHHGSHLL